MTNSTTSNIAVFIDFENFGYRKALDIKLLISKLGERGRLIVKKAYADWSRFAKARRYMLENSIELIELPSYSKGKNLADIKLVVDALETAITKEYVDTVVIVSGDSDYTPLIAKLREYNKYVIVIGSKKQVSKLLAGYCDELIYYSTLVGRDPVEESELEAAYDLLVRAISCLENQGGQVLGSRIKNYLIQLDSSFDESEYGFSQFKHFLEEAGKKGLVSLELTEEHGDYLVNLTQTRAPQTEPVVAQKGVPPSLIYLVYWAIKVNQFGDRTRFSFSEIALTIREHLDPLFELSQYGYSKKQGFKGVLEDMEKQHFVRIKRNSGKGQHYIYPEPKLEEYAKGTLPPANLRQLRCESMSSQLGLTSDLNQIAKFMMEAHSVFAEFQARGDRLTAPHLFGICRRRLGERYDTMAAYNRVVNTIVKSKAILDEHGHPISRTDDNSAIALIEPIDVTLQNCIETIQIEIKINFQEDIEPDTLAELLVYGQDPAFDPAGLEQPGKPSNSLDKADLRPMPKVQPELISQLIFGGESDTTEFELVGVGEMLDPETAERLRIEAQVLCDGMV